MSKKQVIVPSDLSKLVIKYLNTTNRKDKNLLFIEIAKHYQPKIEKLIHNLSKIDRYDIISIYHIQLLTAIQKWSISSANFETYVYPYMLAIPRIFMTEKKMFKQDIGYITMDNDLLSEIFEEDENLWDKIAENKFINNKINKNIT